MGMGMGMGARKYQAYHPEYLLPLLHLLYTVVSPHSVSLACLNQKKKVRLKVSTQQKHLQFVQEGPN